MALFCQTAGRKFSVDLLFGDLEYVMLFDEMLAQGK